MPLLDHFHPPLSLTRHWQGFHSAWAATLARAINRILPPRYFAEPNVQLGGQVEIDVATLETPDLSTGSERSAVATAVWAPSRPRIDAPIHLEDAGAFEVRVFNDEAGPCLVAAIELVSPGNKDRPEARRVFTTNCAAYLQDGVSLVVVDAVTSRTAGLHPALLAALGTDVEALPVELHAAAYRILRETDGARLQVWAETLAVGEDLPVLPLWLEPDYSLPVDLEATYLETCDSLRMPA